MPWSNPWSPNLHVCISTLGPEWEGSWYQTVVNDGGKDYPSLHGHHLDGKTDQIYILSYAAAT